MKKAVTVLLTVMLLCYALAAYIAAESPPSISVKVSISDENGALPAVLQGVTLSDPEGDGYTVDDALRAAHDALYSGGAAAGYASYVSEFGMSLAMLWGNESGAFGYRVNDEAAVGLQAPIKEGDHIKAYIYQDQAGWSDAYAWFDRSEVTLQDGGAITLTLLASGYDADFQLTTAPVADAVITVNGEQAVYRTDAEGKVTLTLAKDAAEYQISAVAQDRVLVPPVCRITVAALQPTEIPTAEPSTQVPICGGDEPGCRSLLSCGALAMLLPILGGMLCSKKER